MGSPIDERQAAHIVAVNLRTGNLVETAVDSPASEQPHSLVRSARRSGQRATMQPTQLTTSRFPLDPTRAPPQRQSAQKGSPAAPTPVAREPNLSMKRGRSPVGRRDARGERRRCSRVQAPRLRSDPRRPRRSPKCCRLEHEQDDEPTAAAGRRLPMSPSRAASIQTPRPSSVGTQTITLRSMLADSSSSGCTRRPSSCRAGRQATEYTQSATMLPARTDAAKQPSWPARTDSRDTKEVTSNQEQTKLPACLKRTCRPPAARRVPLLRYLRKA
jgi:hypothetical protein